MAGSIASESPSAEEVLDIFQEIILSGLAITAAFSDPVRPGDANALVPFALRIISDAGRRGLSQEDLSRTLHRSAPWTTRLVDQLESDGLITRRPHPSDRRVNMLTLSSQGTETLHGFVEKGRTAVLGLFPIQTTVSLSHFKAQLQQFSLIVSSRNHS